MRKLLASLAILALAVPAMADFDNYQGPQTQIAVNLEVQEIGEVFWGSDNANPVNLTVSDFGTYSNAETRTLKVLSNVPVKVDCAIASGDLDYYTVLEVSAGTKTKTFRRDAGNTAATGNFPFVKDASPVGSTAGSTANFVPITFKAHAWNGVANAATKNLVLNWTVAPNS